MWLVDTRGSSGLGLYAIDPRSVTENPYAGTFPDADFVPLDSIPVDALEILETGDQDPSFADNLELVDSGCATFR